MWICSGIPWSTGRLGLLVKKVFPSPPPFLVEYFYNNLSQQLLSPHHGHEWFQESNINVSEWPVIVTVKQLAAAFLRELDQENILEAVSKITQFSSLRDQEKRVCFLRNNLKNSQFQMISSTSYHTQIFSWLGSSTQGTGICCVSQASTELWGSSVPHVSDYQLRWNCRCIPRLAPSLPLLSEENKLIYSPSFSLTFQIPQRFWRVTQNKQTNIHTR